MMFSGTFETFVILHFSDIPTVVVLTACLEIKSRVILDQDKTESKCYKTNTIKNWSQVKYKTVHMFLI